MKTEKEILMTLSEKNGKVIRRPRKIIPKILGLLLVVLW